MSSFAPKAAGLSSIESLKKKLARTLYDPSPSDAVNNEPPADQFVAFPTPGFRPTVFEYPKLLLTPVAYTNAPQLSWAELFRGEKLSLPILNFPTQRWCDVPAGFDTAHLVAIRRSLPPDYQLWCLTRQADDRFTATFTDPSDPSKMIAVNLLAGLPVTAAGEVRACKLPTGSHIIDHSLVELALRKLDDTTGKFIPPAFWRCDEEAAAQLDTTLTNTMKLFTAGQPVQSKNFRGTTDPAAVALVLSQLGLPQASCVVTFRQPANLSTVSTYDPSILGFKDGTSQVTRSPLTAPGLCIHNGDLRPSDAGAAGGAGAQSRKSTGIAKENKNKQEFWPQKTYNVLSSVAYTLRGAKMYGDKWYAVLKSPFSLKRNGYAEPLNVNYSIDDLSAPKDIEQFLQPNNIADGCGFFAVPWDLLTCITATVHWAKLAPLANVSDSLLSAKSQAVVEQSLRAALMQTWSNSPSDAVDLDTWFSDIGAHWQAQGSTATLYDRDDDEIVTVDLRKDGIEIVSQGSRYPLLDPGICEPTDVKYIGLSAAYEAAAAKDGSRLARHMNHGASLHLAYHAIEDAVLTLPEPDHLFYEPPWLWEDSAPWNQQVMAKTFATLTGHPANILNAQTFVGLTAAQAYAVLQAPDNFSVVIVADPGQINADGVREAMGPLPAVELDLHDRAARPFSVHFQVDDNAQRPIQLRLNDRTKPPISVYLQVYEGADPNVEVRLNDRTERPISVAMKVGEDLERPVNLTLNDGTQRPVSVNINTHEAAQRPLSVGMTFNDKTERLMSGVPYSVLGVETQDGTPMVKLGTPLVFPSLQQDRDVSQFFSGQAPQFWIPVKNLQGAAEAVFTSSWPASLTDDMEDFFSEVRAPHLRSLSSRWPALTKLEKR